MSIDLRPATEAVRAYCGATLELSYTVQDSEGQAVDLSGASSKMLLKLDRADADAEAVAEFAIDDSAAASGQFSVSLTATQTASLAPGVYYADHHVNIPAGDNAGDYIVASFVVRFERPVTRSVS